MYHAPFDVRLTTADANGDAQIRTVVQPDICVVCDQTKLDDQGCVGAPDWIIEIVSPGNTARDTKTKFDLYEENGVQEYWIVYPGHKTVSAFVLEDGQY
jgi:Uma2 family endonuclease